MKLKNLFAHRRQSEPYFFAKIASARVLLKEACEHLAGGLTSLGATPFKCKDIHGGQRAR